MNSNMLRINNDQLDAFKAYKQHQFELELQDHIREFFPAHHRLLEEPARARLASYAIARGKFHGFDTKRAVCLYLNAMLVLGADFDRDPVHGWAAPILGDRAGRSARHRINLISNGVQDSITAFGGDRQQHINRAVLAFYRAAPTLMARIGARGVEALPQFAAQLFPEKASYAGTAALEQLARIAVHKSRSFHLPAPAQQLLLAGFQFLFGAGFDTDPQFAQFSAILNDPGAAPEQKTARLVEAAAALVHAFMKAGSAQNTTSAHV